METSKHGHRVSRIEFEDTPVIRDFIVVLRKLKLASDKCELDVHRRRESLRTMMNSPGSFLVELSHGKMTSKLKVQNFVLVMWKLGILPSEELDKWDLRNVDRSV